MMQMINRRRSSAKCSKSVMASGDGRASFGRLMVRTIRCSPGLGR